MIRTSTRLSYANGYLDLGMTAKAAEELDAIPKEDRLRDDVLAMRARYYLEIKEWALMAAVSEQFAKQNPDSAFAWVNWAYALRELNKNADAKAVAQRGLALHPKVATLWFNLACYCSLLGELPEAAEHLKKAIRLDADFKEDAATDPDLENLRNGQANQ